MGISGKVVLRPDPQSDETLPERAPTLADVAQTAQVSTATVSRVLNTPDRVVESTRRRVLEAVKTLGYAPNFNARALAAKRSNTIGAVIPTMENAIFARGLQAFQEELGRHGFTLLVASSSYQEELEDEQIRTLVARGADALLLIGYHRSPALYEFLARRQVPALVAWSFDADQTQAAIGFDNQAAMAELARQAIDLGHRHLGVITAPTAANDRARERLAGVRRAATAARLDAGAIPVVETQYGFDEGETAFRQLMAQSPRTTVVFCGNDVLAIGALRGAKRMGLRVPEDISITGFDDIELAMLAEPGLTTVHVPHREMGRRSALMLVSMLRGEADDPRTKLQTEIRMRDSLGPAPL